MMVGSRKEERRSRNNVERDLVEGLDGFLGDLQQDCDIPAKYTCHRMQLDLEPAPYGPEEVKATRNLLRFSQALFAQFLGVSVKTVSSWEQGATKPADIACRFMDEIQQNPEYYRERINELIKRKECGT